MSQGSTAYHSFVRIHREMGKPRLPDWESLSHIRRMAWEAAAQAVAQAVLYASRNWPEFDFEGIEDEDEDEACSDTQFELSI